MGSDPFLEKGVRPLSWEIVEESAFRVRCYHLASKKGSDPMVPKGVRPLVSARQIW